MRPADLALAVQARADLASGTARKAREAAGLSRGDVARALGVSRQSVRHWETGRSNPTAEHALAWGRLMSRLARHDSPAEDNKAS